MTYTHKWKNKESGKEEGKRRNEEKEYHYNPRIVSINYIKSLYIPQK